MPCKSLISSKSKLFQIGFRDVWSLSIEVTSNNAWKYIEISVETFVKRRFNTIVRRLLHYYPHCYIPQMSIGKSPLILEREYFFARITNRTRRTSCNIFLTRTCSILKIKTLVSFKTAKFYQRSSFSGPHWFFNARLNSLCGKNSQI